MKVIGHAAESMNPIAEAARPLLQQQTEAVAIGIGEEDILAGVATKDDVIKTAWKMDAGFTSHGNEITSTVQLGNLEA
jgi:hypothetical protein